MIALRPPPARWARVDPAGWLVRPLAADGATPPGLRLVCFPHAGGGPAAFRPWALVARQDAAVMAVQLPGREQRAAEAPVASITVAADAVTGALLAWDDGLPLVLYGHSMGTLVALEVAHRLHAAGRTPRLLAVGARIPPDQASRAAALLDLDDDGFFDTVDRLYGGTPVAVRNDPSLRAHYLRLMRADFAIGSRLPATTIDRPPLPCPILALSGADDRAAPPAAMAGWAAFTAGGFSAVTLPGGHFFAIEWPRPAVARILAAARNPAD
ncbi:thioesterase II family protein [Tistrella mobilis]|uniref:thioesterase II family protein n=1 Tax=Tistrella mobilis TaxID=171437 RepID=UPI003558B3FA